MSRPIDAVLLIAFGGPEGPDQVRPFLEHVLRGRRVPPERVEEVVRHYDHFGGESPLPAITRRQAAGLADRLARAGLPIPVYVGMRNWHPFLAETIQQMQATGVRQAVGFIMAPHRSYSSDGQYRQNLEEAIARLRARGEPGIEVVYVGDWHAHPKFVEVNAAHVRAAAARLSAPPRGVFTAHSLPAGMPGAAEYARQVQTSARLVAEAAGLTEWAVAFQSRSGRPEDPWLEPDILAYLRQHHADMAAAVIVPIGFVADHIEVLWDLDEEAARVCTALDLPMARAATANDDPLFLDMMADVVLACVARER